MPTMYLKDKAMPSLSALADVKDVPPVIAVAGALLVLLSGLYVWFLIHSTITSKRCATADGNPLPRPASTLPILHNLFDFIQNADRFHDWLNEQFQRTGGKPWLLSAPGRPAYVMICTPDLIEDVEKTHFESFGKGDFQRDFVFDLFGNTLVNVDGEPWRYQRKTAVKMLTHRALRDYMAEIIHKHTITLDRILTEAMHKKQAVDISRIFSQFTMEVIVEMGYGTEMNNLGSGKIHPMESAIDDALCATMTRFQLPTFVWKTMRLLNIGSEAVMKRSMRLIHKTSMDLINNTIERRAKHGTSAEKTTIVSLFLDAEDPQKIITPTLIRDIVIGSIVAGRDTSAQTLSWAVYCVSRHPNVEAKIRKELTDQLPELRENDSVSLFLSMELLQRLHYLEAVVKEALRLHPAVPFSVRYACDDVVLSDGTFVPKGTFVGISPYSLGRMASVWGLDVLEFRPERWIDAATGKLRTDISQFQFNSFHAGPRLCVGMTLAMLEMKTVLAKIYSKYHVAMVPDQTITYGRSLTLPIKGPLMVRFDRALPLIA